VKLVKADVNSSGRIWTLFEVTTGEDAGTRFFGSKYGLTGSDAEKTAKAQGFFKKAMIDFGLTEHFFIQATSVADFPPSLIGVEGKAKVKVRTYTKDGEERQSNEVTAFELKSRPNLILPGGAPTIIPMQTTAPVQTPQPTAPTFVQAGGAPQQTTPQPIQAVDEVAELRAKLEAAETAAAANSKTTQPTTAAAGVARDHPDPGF
jgi:hypothetical protein